MAPPVIARAVGPKQSPPLSRKSGRSIQGGIPMPLSSSQIAALRTLSSPTVANAIETFKVRPREAGNLSSDIRALFPELGPVVGYAVTALIRAEHPAAEGKRASTFAWWDYIQTIPVPRIVVMHDLDQPQGQGAHWGEVQANIHSALGCVGVVTDGSVRDLDEVRRLGFHFCAAHVSVSHANVHLVDFGIPVKVGAVWINPGDLLHGDQHGVVMVPHEIAERIPRSRRARRRRRAVDHPGLPGRRHYRRALEGDLQIRPRRCLLKGRAWRARILIFLSPSQGEEGRLALNPSVSAW